MPPRAGVISGNVILSCAMRVIAGNVIAVCLFIVLSVLPPNRRLQLTPLRVDRDRANFESRFRLDGHLILSMRRN